MQWDMDELRRKHCEMESDLKTEQNEKTCVESEKTFASGEKEILLEELETKREEVTCLQMHLEAKYKADTKVLFKEVKFLRNAQSEIKKVLNQYLEEKTGLQAQLLARHDEQETSDDGGSTSNGKSLTAMSTDGATCTNEETTKILTDLLIDNAQLRMPLNSVMRSAVNTAAKPEKEGSDGLVSKKTILNWFLDR